MEGLQALLEKEYNLAVQDNNLLSDERTIGSQLAAARFILSQLRSSFKETKPTTSQQQISPQSRLVLFQLVENFLRQKAMLTESETSASSKETVARRITLMNELLKLFEEIFPEYNLSDSWQLDSNLLVQKYLNEGVRKDLRAFWQTMNKCIFTGKIEQQETGRLRTRLPASIIQIVDSQASAAKRRLSPKLCEIVSEMLQAIEQSWEMLSAMQFCGFINDVDRLRDLMDRRNLKYLSRPSFKKQAETLHHDTIHLSQQTSSLLARRLMKELVNSNKLLSNIGDARWEADESRKGAVRTISVLKVQYKRFQSYLGNEFPRFLKACFDQTLQLYVESLLRNTVRRPCSAGDVSKALDADYAVFLNFYNGDFVDSHFGRRGFYTLQTLNHHLHLLKSIANVIQPDRSADDLKQDVKALLRAFEPTDKATRVVLHFVALNQSSDGFDSTSWMDVITKARNENMKEDTLSFSFDSKLEFPLMENSGETATKVRRTGQERPVAKCIRNLKKPPVVLRAQSDTVSVV